MHPAFSPSILTLIPIAPPSSVVVVVDRVPFLPSAISQVSFFGLHIVPLASCARFSSYISTVFYFPRYRKTQLAFHGSALLHHSATLPSSLITSSSTVSSCPRPRSTSATAFHQYTAAFRHTPTLTHPPVLSSYKMCFGGVERHSRVSHFLYSLCMHCSSRMTP